MWFLAGAIALAGAATGVALWLTVGGSGEKRTALVRVSEGGLETLARVVPHPIYWAGPMPATTYELSQESDGSVAVRYLPRGVETGTKAAYLSVGTYPVANAFAVTRAAARGKGAVRVNAPGGAVAFYGTSRPNSVYLARPGSDYQVEVFDPSPARARRLVSSGRIAPVRQSAGLGSAVPRLVTPAELRKGVSAAHPVYWLGPKPGRSYELTQNAEGAVFIRYLPPGLKAGDPKARLTVATYPFPHARKALKATAQNKGLSSISVPGGGLALLDPRHPDNIHLAFPGSGYQVEVFAPPPDNALSIVKSGAVRPVG